MLHASSCEPISVHSLTSRGNCNMEEKVNVAVCVLRELYNIYITSYNIIAKSCVRLRMIDEP